MPRDVANVVQTGSIPVARSGESERFASQAPCVSRSSSEGHGLQLREAGCDSRSALRGEARAACGSLRARLGGPKLRSSKPRVSVRLRASALVHVGHGDLHEGRRSEPWHPAPLDGGT